MKIILAIILGFFLFQNIALADIYGTTGNDTINCTNGNDIVWAGSGNDTINCQQGGDDRIYGQGGNDIINVGDANSRNITAYGGSGEDIVNQKSSEVPLSILEISPTNYVYSYANGFLKVFDNEQEIDNFSTVTEAEQTYEIPDLELDSYSYKNNSKMLLWIPNQFNPVIIDESGYYSFQVPNNEFRIGYQSLADDKMAIEYRFFDLNDPLLFYDLVDEIDESLFDVGLSVTGEVVYGEPNSYLIVNVEQL